eukprot:6099424-Pyramimonas_sp.AAC.1
MSISAVSWATSASGIRRLPAGHRRRGVTGSTARRARAAFRLGGRARRVDAAQVTAAHAKGLRKNYS